MRTILLLTVFICLCSVFACSKSDTTPPNTPQNPSDSSHIDTTHRDTGNTIIPGKPFLDSGWSSVKVAYSGLQDVSVLGNGLIYVLQGQTSDSLFRSTDGGQSWTAYRGPKLGGSVGFNLYVSPDGKVFTTSLEVFNAKAQGYVSRWNGVSFDTIHVGKPVADLYSVGSKWFASLTAAPFLAESNDGGQTWHDVETGITDSQVDLGSTFRYNAFHFSDTLHGAMGIGTSFFMTSTGIQHWRKLSSPTIPGYFTSVALTGNGSVYAGTVLGYMFKSADGQQLVSLPGFPPYGNTTAGFTDLKFFDDQEGYSVFRDCVYHTLNGGAKWDTVVYQPGKVMVELDFFDRKHGAVGLDDGNLLLFKK